MISHDSSLNTWLTVVDNFINNSQVKLIMLNKYSKYKVGDFCTYVAAWPSRASSIDHSKHY